MLIAHFILCLVGKQNSGKLGTRYQWQRKTLVFFTNELGATLLHRFMQTLKDVQFSDVLVGYFQTSGFHQLYHSSKKLKRLEYWLVLG